MEIWNDVFSQFFEEQNVPYYNFNKARLSVLDRSDPDYGDKEGHMGGELAEEYSEVLAEVLKGHFNGTLDETKYFYNTFDEMYKEMEEQKMSFTTVAFFVFLLAGIVVYNDLPKNVQWIWLLIFSYIYYFTFSIKASLFMVFATVTIYFGGIWLQNIQNTGDRYLKDNKETLSREDKKAYKESR